MERGKKERNYQVIVRYAHSWKRWGIHVFDHEMTPCAYREIFESFFDFGGLRFQRKLKRTAEELNSKYPDVTLQSIEKSIKEVASESGHKPPIYLR